MGKSEYSDIVPKILVVRVVRRMWSGRMLVWARRLGSHSIEGFRVKRVSGTIDRGNIIEDRPDNSVIKLNKLLYPVDK